MATSPARHDRRPTHWPAMPKTSAGREAAWMSRKTGKGEGGGGRLAGCPGYHLLAGRGRQDLHAAHLAEGSHVLGHLLLVRGVHDQVQGMATVNHALAVDLDPERPGAGLGDVLSQHRGDLWVTCRAGV